MLGSALTIIGLPMTRVPHNEARHDLQASPGQERFCESRYLRLTRYILPDADAAKGRHVD